MIEADAGEFGERDGEDGEIDAGHAEAKSQKADDRAGGGGDRERRDKAEPGRNAETA